MSAALLNPLLETFTGEIPFKRVQTSQVVMRIVGGERPERPIHPKFTDPLWELTMRCWKVAPQDRPKMDDVLEELLAPSFFISMTKFSPTQTLTEALDLSRHLYLQKVALTVHFPLPPRY